MRHPRRTGRPQPATGEGGEEQSKETPAKPCGGRPGHPGRSRTTKPDRTVAYKAEMCDGCCGTDLELLDPIKKPVEDFWKGACEEDEDGEKRDAYTALITMGWCDTCNMITNPAPRLVWGTSLGPKALATLIQYRSNPQGRSSIMSNFRAIHRFGISAGAVSNTLTAFAKSQEGGTLPDSVAAFVMAKMEAQRGLVQKSAIKRSYA